MALFCDFENIALGVRDASNEKNSTSSPSSNGYWPRVASSSRRPTATGERYRGFKATMHEANFELINPHVRQSGKNSADIRLVVDALDLCYTKSHVDTFVIISGDSDFPPRVQAAGERQTGDRRRRQTID